MLKAQKIDLNSPKGENVMPQLQPGKPWLLFADPDTLLPYQLAQREDMIQGLLILGGLAIAPLLVVLLPIWLMRRYEKNPPKEFMDAMGNKTMMGRVGVNTEIAGAFCYLLSDASSFVDGTSITVDGGWTAW